MDNIYWEYTKVYSISYFISRDECIEKFKARWNRSSYQTFSLMLYFSARNLVIE